MKHPYQVNMKKVEDSGVFDSEQMAGLKHIEDEIKRVAKEPKDRNAFFNKFNRDLLQLLAIVEKEKQRDWH